MKKIWWPKHYGQKHYGLQHYGQNNKRSTFCIDDQQLVDSEMERDLGIIFCSNLKWKNQAITAANRANRMLGRIKKSFSRLDCNLLRSLYLSFVRPLLEFAAPVWSPIMKSDCDILERIQHRATKMVPSIRHQSYENRLKTLDLPTLDERRRRDDMIQMFKIINRFGKLE